MKHTKGPWKINGKNSEGYFQICKNNGGWNIALVLPRSSENASLITASPDLLEACRQIIKIAEDDGWYNDFDFKGKDRKRIALDIARQAIAKAEGRE